MKKLILIIFIIFSNPLRASDFETTIKWIYQLPADSTYSLSSSAWRVCSDNLQVIAKYSRPHGIESLHWNDLSAVVGFGNYGVAGRFNSYGLNDLYISNSYDLGFAFRPSDFMALYIGGRHVRESFLKKDKYNRTDFNARLAARKGKALGAIGVDGITVHEDYDSAARRNRLWGALTYAIKSDISLSASVREFENGRRRWLFSQRMNLSRAVSVSIGLIDRPDVIFGQLNFGYGSFTFDLSYYSVGHLADTVVLGLGFGRKK